MYLQDSDLPFPVSSIEFEKVYMVMDKRIAMGYSDKELSFLLGYRSMYVRDVENPLHTLRYTPKDTNYLWTIFNCSLAELMPAKVADEFYQIKVVSALDHSGEMTYQIFILKAKEFVLYRVVETNGSVPAIEAADVAQAVQGYVTGLFLKGFFDDPKTALEVFHRCIRKFGKNLRPRFVMDALSYYTSKKHVPKLIRQKNLSARTVYIKES